MEKIRSLESCWGDYPKWEFHEASPMFFHEGLSDNIYLLSNHGELEQEWGAKIKWTGNLIKRMRQSSSIRLFGSRPLKKRPAGAYSCTSLAWLLSEPLFSCTPINWESLEYISLREETRSYSYLVFITPQSAIRPHSCASAHYLLWQLTMYRLGDNGEILGHYIFGRHYKLSQVGMTVLYKNPRLFKQGHFLQ